MKKTLLTRIQGLARILFLAGLLGCVAQPGGPGQEAPTNTHPPEITATRTLRPKDPEASPTHTLAPIQGERVAIKSIHMQSENAGWAIGSLPGGDDLILQSADGGSSWRDVSPPDLDAPEGRGGKEASAFFLSQERAWVTTYPSEGGLPEAAAVWSSKDGGQNWEASQLPALGEEFVQTAGPRHFVFIDDQHGWLMLELGAGLGHSYVGLYRTKDGGESWQPVADPQDLESGNLHTCCQTGMAFASPEIGLVTFSPGPNETVLVSWTQDGGDSWEPRELPAPGPGVEELEFYGWACASHSPRFFSEQHGLLGVECSSASNPDGPGDAFLYRTSDGGLTWVSYAYPGGKLFFLEEELGWALGQDIYETRDGGSTWEAIASPGWEGAFNIVSEEVWWAVATSEETVSLWKSRESGRSWEQVEATLIPSEQE